MFDIGFLEILLISIVALLVVGPERLPSLARQVGFWVGRAKQFIGSVQSEFNDEIKKADDIQKMVQNQLEIKELHETIELDDSKPTVAVPRSQPTNEEPNSEPNKDSNSPTTDGQEKEKIPTRD